MNSKVSRQSAAEAVMNSATATATALALAKTVSETAANLAVAKANSDTTMALMGADISRIKTDITEINKTIKDSVASFVSMPDFKIHMEADADHEKRIRKLEGFMDTLTGKMWGIGAIAGIVVGIISFVANHLWK